MLYLADVLQFVVYRFYYRAFPQQYLVGHGHQGVLHVVPDGCDKLYPVDEQHFHQAFPYIALIGEELSVYPVKETFFFERFPIVHVRLRYGKVEYFSPVVYDDVQFEAMEPAHGRTPRSGDALEYLVVGDALVLADPDRGRINEGNTGAVAKTASLKEQGHGHQVALHKLGKPVIGDRIGEVVLHMGLYVEYIKMLEAPETAQLEYYR